MSNSPNILWKLNLTSFKKNIVGNQAKQMDMALLRLSKHVWRQLFIVAYHHLFC